MKAGLLTYECALCKISEWAGKKLSLELDHKNGDKFDWRIENLRLLCPNCHSQTDTWGGRNPKRIISDGVHRDGEAQLSRLRDGSAGLGQRSRLSR